MLDSNFLTREHYVRLFEVYGGLLTDKQQALFKALFHLDLSYQEIAEQDEVSKAAIADMVKTIKHHLDTYEQQLNIVKKIQAVENLLTQLNLDEKLLEAIKLKLP
jgi:predicted DNA-binding protein YlxM (UPF0122 family)